MERPQGRVQEETAAKGGEVHRIHKGRPLLVLLLPLRHGFVRENHKRGKGHAPPIRHGKLGRQGQVRRFKIYYG